MQKDLSHLKKQCAACERSDMPMNKEHLFPKWLIHRTRTHKTGIRWGDRREVPALATTFPLCERCNSEFGRELEAPVRKLFDEIENRQGISDNDAELLIRWMWKIHGLAWLASTPNGKYTAACTLRQRVLHAINQIRGRLIFAVALFQELNPDSRDYPLGMDSDTAVDAIFASGVFSRIAAMVVFDKFASLVPSNFAQYRLLPRRHPSGDAKLFYPKIGFDDDVEAVGITRMVSQQLSAVHDEFAMASLEIAQRFPKGDA